MSLEDPPATIGQAHLKVFLIALMLATGVVLFVHNMTGDFEQAVLLGGMAFLILEYYWAVQHSVWIELNK